MRRSQNVGTHTKVRTLFASAKSLLIVLSEVQGSQVLFIRIPTGAGTGSNHMGYRPADIEDGLLHIHGPAYCSTRPTEAILKSAQIPVNYLGACGYTGVTTLSVSSPTQV